MKKILWPSIILILLVIYFTNIYHFLSDSHPVDADVLIVEGWLQPELFDEIIEEFNSKNYKFIATTGVPFIPEFRMPYSGSLIFNLSNDFELEEASSYTIEVNAYSTVVKNVYAKMGLLVNDSLITEVETSANSKTYSTSTILPNSKINTIAIRFMNDAIDNGEDRDLIVIDLKVNGKKYLPRSEGVLYDRGKPGGDDIYSANFKSVAEEAALLLQKKGINRNRVIFIPSEEMEINRTYNSALAFGKWLNTYPNLKELKGINVISTGTHARRSWILFKQHIQADIPVGIISLKSVYTPDENWWKSSTGIKNVLIESIKYVYTLFL